MKNLSRIFFLLLLPLAVLASPRNKIDSLLRVLPKQQDTIRIKTLIKLSQAYFGVNEDSAMLFSRELLKEAIKNGSQERVSEAYFLIGSCFRHISQPDSALLYKHLALRVAEKSGFKKGIANACSDIGLYEKDYGQFDSAKIYMLRAISIREEINDQKLLGTSYINLGLLFYTSKDFTNAMSYYRKAEEVFVKIKQPKNVALVLNNMGSVYDELKQYDSSLVFYNRALAIRDSLHDQAGISQAYLNIGVTYRNLKDYEQSEKYLSKAYEIKSHLGEEREDLAMCMLDLAQTLRLKKNYGKAISYLGQAEKIAVPAKLKELERDICLEYSNIYSAQGKYEEALKYMNLYVEKKDSLLDEARVKSLNELQVKYETAKKEKENGILREQAKLQDAEKERDRLALERDENITTALYAGIGILILFLGLAFYAYRVKIKSNLQITKQNSTLKELNKKLIESEEELSSLNKTKDKLLSVISHDISNPVKAIANYNQAILAKENELNREQLSEALKKVNQSVQPLQGFIDNLLHWSLLQRNGTASSPEVFSAGEIVNEIISLYQAYANQKNVSLLNTISTGVKINADKNMFRLVMRNLLSNAIKYSPEGRTVTIAATVSSDEICFEIKDEGEGISPEKITSILAGKTIGSQKGTYSETGTGLGLNLVTEFLKMNGSELKIKSAVGRGSVFSFGLLSAQ